MNLERLVSALKSDEGFRGQVYDDATGVIIKPGYKVEGTATVGYGRNLIDNPLTYAEADHLLTNDAIRALRDAADLVKTWVLLDDVRQNVLGNMAFNLGKTRLSKFVKFLDAVERNGWHEAADEMKDSAWYGQVGRRARRLEREMRTGEVEA